MRGSDKGGMRRTAVSISSAGTVSPSALLAPAPSLNSDAGAGVHGVPAGAGVESHDDPSTARPSSKWSNQLRKIDTLSTCLLAIFLENLHFSPQTILVERDHNWPLEKLT